MLLLATIKIVIKFPHCTKIWYITFAGMPIIATSGPSANVVGIPMGPELKMDPYFIEAQHTTSKNITVYTGQTAFMECRVRNLGAKLVRKAKIIVENSKVQIQFRQKEKN